MTESKQPQLTHYFSKIMASKGVEVVDALRTDGVGNRERVLYNISVWEGEGDLSKDQTRDNERGQYYLETYQDAVKVGLSSQMDHRFVLTSEDVQQRLL